MYMQSAGNLRPTKISVSIDDNGTGATGVITTNNTALTANDTITVNGRAYKAVAALTGAVDEFLIGADGDAGLANLRTLINSGRAAVKAAQTLTSDNVAPSNTETVVVGGKTYTFKTALTEAKATVTLTATSPNVVAGETVTLDTIIYTFVAALPDGSRISKNMVVIGADYDTTLGNLVAAINGATGEGTKYGWGTVAHPTVSAAAVAAHATVITAKSIGTAANSIVSTETSGHLSFGAATLTGGLAAVANEIFIGVDADTCLTNLAAAINGTAGAGTLYSSNTVASTEATAGAVIAHAIILTAITAGAAGNSLASTETSLHLSYGATTFAGGIDASTANVDVTCGAVTAHAVTLTSILSTFAANAITLAKSAVTITLSGLSGGATGTLTGGGSTIGTAAMPADFEGGLLHEIVSVAPQFTGTPTYTIALLDADGVQYYVTGNLNENATTNTDVADMEVGANDTIKITTSTKVEETLPIVVLLR